MSTVAQNVRVEGLAPADMASMRANVHLLLLGKLKATKTAAILSLASAVGP